MALLERFEMACPRVQDGVWVVPSMLKERALFVKPLNISDARRMFERTYELEVIQDRACNLIALNSSTQLLGVGCVVWYLLRSVLTHGIHRWHQRVCLGVSSCGCRRCRAWCCLTCGVMACSLDQGTATR